mmetsp:Transcript_5025/g.9503  ORF Transcript_5025/g.9503 Transcript_5025/m.9503 type:complete len:230 (-) Transcript_5025:467-1156(-)
MSFLSPFADLLASLSKTSSNTIPSSSAGTVLRGISSASLEAGPANRLWKPPFSTDFLKFRSSCAAAIFNPSGCQLNMANRYIAICTSPTTESLTAPVSASLSPVSRSAILGTITPGVSITYILGRAPIRKEDMWRVTPGLGPIFAGLLLNVWPRSSISMTLAALCMALMRDDLPQLGTPTTIRTRASFLLHSFRTHSWIPWRRFFTESSLCAVTEYASWFLLAKASSAD